MERSRPVTEIVTRLCLNLDNPFSHYQEHCAPLNIKASGDVLIIGAGVWFEEVAVIEDAIAAGSVKSLSLVGSDKTLAFLIDKALQENYSIRDTF